MKYNYKRLYSHFWVLVAMLLCSATYAQRSISGTVVDENNEPLIGVNILIQGTTTGAVTDLDGNYSLQANEGDVLVFSYTGFSTTEVQVGAEDNINVTMQEGAALDEVVVVGYSKQRKVTVTGAVVAVEGKEIIKSPAVDITNSLAGRLPGLVAIQTSGEPGYDGARIRIRGVNTLGNSEPLVVIDGIPDRAGGLGRIAPGDIESISVLKDASAAIYGARAANGVILITTKRGAEGKPTITYDFNQGWTQSTVLPPMASAPEYARIMNEINLYAAPSDEWQAGWQALETNGIYQSPTEGVGTINAVYSPEAIRKYEDGSDPWGHPDTDWFGDAIKNWSPLSRHNLQITGGSEAVRYMASMGFQNQDGIYHNSATGYKQYNLRTNLDAKVNNYVSANLGVLLRREERLFPTQSAGAIFRMLMRGRPTEPEVWPNGLPGPDIENGQNPYVITTNATGYEEDPQDYVQLNGGIDITNPWIDGLTLTLSGSVDKFSRLRKRWETPWMLYRWDGVSYEDDGVTPALEGAIRSNFTDPRLDEFSQSRLNTNLSALLNYERQIGDHAVTFLAGVTRETFEGAEFGAFRRNYISAAVDQLFAGGTEAQNTRGSAFNRARLGYYGRVGYNYQEKYLAEFIWRYDGSYIFPEEDRFGFFPGVLVGWNITNEPFFNSNFISYLKLRASYGQMGNDQVFFNDELQEYAFLSTYSFGRYPIDGRVVNTLFETGLANPSFTWEVANNYNIGVDGTLFGGNLDFSLEYFYNKRNQILIQLSGSTPLTSGINNLLPPVNAGEVENKGFEFSFNYNGGSSSGLRWSVGANGGYARNEVVFLDEVPGIPDYQRREGKPIGSRDGQWLVYQSDGVFQTQADIESESLDYSAIVGSNSNLRPGDMKFEDVNGDGKIDADDRVRADENLVPTFTFGIPLNFSYKNFDLSLLFQGATGAQLRVQTESGDIGNFLKYSHDNRWSIDNPSSEHPRLASRGNTYYTNGGAGNNTYWLFDKDYLRLKNLEFGYTLPADVLQKVGLGSLRLYVNGLNLLTWSKFDFFDPETENGAGTYYPQQRIINTGLSISF